MFWRFFNPTKDSSPSELAVLGVATSALFIIVGIISFVAGFCAPEEKHAAAVVLEHLGSWLMVSGWFILMAMWLVRRWMD